MGTPVNTAVKFLVSEPEDFYFDNGEGPFDGVIVGYSPGVVFMKARSELRYHNKKIHYLAAVARYDGESISELKTDPHIIVNLVPLLVDGDVNDASIEDLVNLAKRFRGQHLIGEIWVAA